MEHGDAPEVVHGRLTWLGHSTTLMELGGARILTDPVTRTRVAHLRRASAVPSSALSRIDLVLLSHAHWDHLDLPSLEQIGRSTTVVVPSGAGALLTRRGFRDVVEVEAGDVIGVKEVSIRATHAEHTAKRGPFGVRAPSLQPRRQCRCDSYSGLRLTYRLMAFRCLMHDREFTFDHAIRRRRRTRGSDALRRAQCLDQQDHGTADNQRCRGEQAERQQHKQRGRA